MKTNRLLLFSLILLTVLASGTIGLYAMVTSQQAPFADEINIWVPNNVSPEMLDPIVTASGGELLGPAGLDSGLPDETVWLVEVPGAKNQGDTQRVLSSLLSHPEIRNGELNNVLENQN